MVYSGKVIREVALPGVGSVSGFSGKRDDSPLYFSFTNYKTSSTQQFFQIMKANHVISKKEK